MAAGGPLGKSVGLSMRRSYGGRLIGEVRTPVRNRAERLLDRLGNGCPHDIDQLRAQITGEKARQQREHFIANRRWWYVDQAALDGPIEDEGRKDTEQPATCHRDEALEACPEQ